EIQLIPDFVLGLRFRDGSNRCFMVEIDRVTMPISRSDFRQTSVERRRRAYLTAHANTQHKQQFGWKTFRVLMVTTDNRRLRSLMEAVKTFHIPNGIGASLFFFSAASELATSDPLSVSWRDGNNTEVRLAK